MNGSNNKNPLMAISTLFVLFAALGVIIYDKVPLKKLRPVSEINELSEHVRARLWQDPFSAVFDSVQQAKRETEKGPVFKHCSLTNHQKMQFMETGGKTGTLQQTIEKRLAEGPITFLGVMVFGGPYAEVTESRIRHRYAVLSGLRRLGFATEDPEHIGFIRIQTTDKPPDDQILLENILPFEWLHKEDKKEFVLLLWLNDDAFQKTPLAKLRCLKTYLGKDNATHDNLRFKVIGPAGSTTLLEMIKELNNPWNSDLDGSPAGFQIYSASATVSNSLLLQAAKVEMEKADDRDLSNEIQELFRKLDIEFHRTISTDQELSDLLIDELNRRPEAASPFFRKHQDHLVLIAEWDTLYGRSLPEIFLNVIRQKHNLNSDDKVDWVHRYSYLRGLDGILIGENDQTNREESDQISNRQGKANLKSLEEPWGRSQCDYLRRLADSIYIMDQRKRKNREGAIKAIGVLGSDFYDKFLVLQALKQRFPQAIFFTTDLDARLFHDNYITWTRNLVVASAFDLELSKDLQCDMPPFRSSYQTSAFYATLQAFCDQDQASAQELTEVCKDFKQKDVKYPPKPFIFEIGQKSAVNLTSRDISTDSRGILRALFFIILILLLVFLLSRSVRNCLKSVQLEYLIVIGVLLSLIFYGLLFYFELYIVIRPGEEPLLWTEGVSVWPTEFLRLIALVFTWVFFAIGIKSLRKSDSELAKEFHFSDGVEGDQSPNQHHENQQIKPQGWWHNLFINWEVKKEEDGIHINKLWEEYLRRGSLTKQILFVLFVLLIYVPVSMSLVGFFDWPICPVRGDLSRRLDIFILILTIPSFMFLTFFIFSTTRLCCCFIDITLKKEPNWDLRSKKLFPQNVDLEEKDLSYWMLVRLIAKRTEVVGRLIFYPFIIWFILFASRLRYFDNWRTPIGLAIVISLPPLISWSCAFLLRHSAEKVRARIVDHLSKKLINVYSGETLDQKGKERLSFVLNEVKSMRKGAFAPFLQQPIIQSLFVPFGGVGGLALIDFLTKIN